MIIGEMYRVPGTNEKKFLKDYGNILNTLKSENKEIIIGTDQNMDYLKINKHNNTSELLDINFDNNILPTIIRPTRVTHNSATLIDNIYVSHKLSTNYKSGIIITDISDHYPCFVIINNIKQIKKEPMEFKTKNN